MHLEKKNPDESVMSCLSLSSTQAVVVVRHPEYRVDPIGPYQCDIPLLFEACDNRAFDDIASRLQQMKTTTGAEELDE
jgi:hypothetical protein